MTKKHFKALAAAIARLKDEQERRNIAGLIGTICASANPLFDWQRWRIACNVGE